MAEGKKGIDRNILIAVGVIVIIGLIIFVAKWATRQEDCVENFDFKMSSLSATVGEAVEFTYLGEPTELSWQLGDKTIDTTAVSFKYVFTTPGNFKIKVTAGSCTSLEKTLVINPDLTKRVDEGLPQPVIEGPTEVKAGEPVKFKETSGLGNKWEWFFSETGGVDDTVQQPTYKFQTPGKKQVTVIINGKSKRADLEVNVKPVPMAKPAAPGGGGAPKKVAGISEAQFKDMLMKLENMETDIFAFRDAMCNYLSMPVSVNGVEKPFSTYCSGLRLSRDQEILKVELQKDDQGCVTNVKITQRKIEE